MIVTIALGVVANATWAGILRISPERISLLRLVEFFYFVFVAAVGMFLGRWLSKRFDSQWKILYEKANTDYLEANKDRGEYREKYAEVANELNLLKATQRPLRQHPIPEFRLKILEACVDLQALLGKHGEPVKVTALPDETLDKTMARISTPELRQARIKFVGDYRLNHRPSILQLRDELKARCGISDTELDQAISFAEDGAGSANALEKVIERLWEIARNVNA